MIENLTNTETTKQGFCPSPPLKRKAPQDCFRSYIDQIQDGLYSSSKLVRNEPRTNRDIYFKFRPRKARPTEMRSIRRHYSHRSVALFRTKKGGSTRANIAYMTCSFVELDGSTDGTIKSLEDVLNLVSKNNLPTESCVSQTSPGNFHITWDYSRPLPFTSKGESYWLAQQRRLIQLFEQGGFLVDKGASTNPTQNLRNPSQLSLFNYKRRCKVYIHKTFKKTSLRAIYKALNGANIPNPTPMKASVRLRRFLRANQTFTLTHKELAITLGTCTKTAQREVRRAVQNGDIQIVARTGNNKRFSRATRYTSNLYIEPNSQKGHLSISKNNSLRKTDLLSDFQAYGAEKGRRNRTLFALGLEIKSELGKQACIESIRAELMQGAMHCHVPIKEFERTLQNVMKPEYTHPLSRAKLQDWGLLEEPKHFH